MPKLTSQDKDSYKKLYNAAITLNSKIPDGDQSPTINASFTLKELTSAFCQKLTEPVTVSSFEQLQAQVELTGGYLTMYRFFTESLDSSETFQTGINRHYQELLMQYKQLKMSLEAVNQDFLDNLTVSCDSLFLTLLKDRNTRECTEKLLSDQGLPMNCDIQQLVYAWEGAVKAFVEDAKQPCGQLKPGETKTIAQFFCIHEQLEKLYSELSSAALNS